MKKTPFKQPKLQAPRPEPFPIPEGAVITRLPPGVARGAEPTRYRSLDPDHYATPSKRLLKVTVTCPKCSHENTRMLNRTQLQRARLKCEK
jgi:hypothetical protein